MTHGSKDPHALDVRSCKGPPGWECVSQGLCRVCDPLEPMSPQGGVPQCKASILSRPSTPLPVGPRASRTRGVGMWGADATSLWSDPVHMLRGAPRTRVDAPCPLAVTPAYIGALPGTQSKVLCERDPLLAGVLRAGSPPSGPSLWHCVVLGAAGAEEKPQCVFPRFSFL